MQNRKDFTKPVDELSDVLRNMVMPHHNSEEDGEGESQFPQLPLVSEADSGSNSLHSYHDIEEGKSLMEDFNRRDRHSHLGLINRSQANNVQGEDDEAEQDDEIPSHRHLPMIPSDTSSIRNASHSVNIARMSPHEIPVNMSKSSEAQVNKQPISDHSRNHSKEQPKSSSKNQSSDEKAHNMVKGSVHSDMKIGSVSLSKHSSPRLVKVKKNTMFEAEEIGPFLDQVFPFQEFSQNELLSEIRPGKNNVPK